MESPFDKKNYETSLSVQVGDMFYRGDEIVAYYDDILKTLQEGEKSVENKIQFYNMAKILIQKREYRKASGVIFQALSRYKKDIELLKLKVEILIKLREYERAIETLDEMLKETPNDVSLLLKKAQVFSFIGDEDAEEIVYKQILKIPYGDFATSRGKIVAMRHLGNIYFKRRKFKEAEEVIRKVIIKAPDEPTWALYFNLLSKLGWREKSAKARDEFARYKRARVYFDKGVEYEMRNKYNLALANYRKGLEIYPKDPPTNHKVGTLLMYRKKWYSRAEEYLKKAVELDPDLADYHSTLVICLINQGKYREAFEEAKIAESLDPLSNIYHLRRLAIKLGRKDEFEKIVKKAIDEDKVGNMPSLRFELGLFYEALGDKKEAEYWYKKALQLYLDWIEKHPEDTESYLELGSIYKRMKMYEEAEAAFKIAERLPGADLEDIYENLVQIYQESRQPEKSIPYLKKLIRIKPQNPLNYIDLGINYLARFTSSLRSKKDMK